MYIYGGVQLVRKLPEALQLVRRLYPQAPEFEKRLSVYVHARMMIPVLFPVCAKRAVPRTYGHISSFHLFPLSVSRSTVPHFPMFHLLVCPFPHFPLPHSFMLLFAQFHIFPFPHLPSSPVPQFPIAPVRHFHILHFPTRFLPVFAGIVSKTH